MLFKQISKNKNVTRFLVFIFCILVLITGSSLGFLLTGNILYGLIGTIIGLSIYVPITYITSSKQVLAMSGAKEIHKADYPELYNIVEELTIPARIPMPKVYIIYDSALNAFATGVNPEKASVAVTSGLLEKLNKEELTGVIAHEIAHIRNYDIRLMTVTIALVSIIVLITDIGSRLLFFRNGGGNRNPVIIVVAIASLVLSPILARIMKMAVSRNREYLADATAVSLTRNPHGLISALETIENDTKVVKNAKTATSGMYFSNPLRKSKDSKNNFIGKVMQWFSTHPLTEDRIDRLNNM